MGTVTMGGNLVTRSGLIFVGAALDQYLRALDERTGRVYLPAAKMAAPAAGATGRSGPVPGSFEVLVVGK